MYGAAIEVRIIHVTALGMPGGIGVYSWCGDECTERFRESSYEPAIGRRFVPFDDFPPVVRALIAQHANRPVGALLRDFQVLAS